MSEVKTDSVVNVSGDSDSGIDLSTNDVVAIKTADSERLRVDASGNVGIGTTTGDVTSDGNASRTYVTIQGTANRGRLNLGCTASNGADTATLGFTNGANTVASISCDSDSGSQTAGNISFATAGSVRATIDSDGDLGIGGSPGNIRFKVSNTENKITQFLHASNGSYTDHVLEMETAKVGASDFSFIISRTNNGGDLEFKVRGDGQVSADGSFSGGGADYAEYFEWSDGNVSSEDRRGYSVVLDGNKVRKATSDDAASSIIGVVSANPSVVGDSGWNKWHGKHETDDYGTVVTETCSLVTWTETPDDETAAPISHTYYTDRVPDGITVPDDAVVTSNQTRPQESSSYDASVPYIPREERKEWDAIGMMGKLRMRVGQPTGDRWIKLRDISSDVEEWLVR